MTVVPKTRRESERNNLNSLIARFKAEQAAIEVNFRRLMPVDVGARHAHSIHPYPAKLLVNIPQFFLSALSPDSGSVLLDPFCGSGTVLYEGAIAGLKPVGSDSNPLARLITKAKLTPIDREDARTQLKNVIAVHLNAAPTIPDVVNRTYWFSDRISDALGRLRTAIDACVPSQHRALFDVSFSAAVRRVSYADPRLSVPVKINPERSARYGAKGDEVIRRLERLDKVDVGATFWGIVNQNIQRCLPSASGTPPAECQIFSDARAIAIDGGTVDLAITSPPYVGAQKYIRASGLSLGWLGLTPNCKLRHMEQLSIGREHLTAAEAFVPEGTSIEEADALLELIAERNPLRARIAQRYLLEMRDALTELARTMKDNANLVLVVGPNLVSGFEFPTPAYLEQLAKNAGFTTRLHLVDSIDSRGLMTKRNRTAGVIQQESVFLLQRKRTND